MVTLNLIGDRTLIGGGRGRGPGRRTDAVRARERETLALRMQDPGYAAARKAKRRAWVEANREHIAAYRRERNAKLWRDPATRTARQALSRKHSLKKRYGLTPDQADALLASQGGVCACCGTAPGTRWHVDHDHVSGVVRGILCVGCNVLIGRLGDRAEEVERRVAVILRYLAGANKETN